jgi:hypothetical protein
MILLHTYQSSYSLSFNHNLTIVGVNVGQQSKYSWFIGAASNTPQFAISNVYQKQDSSCQARIFIIGLQNIQIIAGDSGKATLISNSGTPVECVYITDKYYKVSNIKVLQLKHDITPCDYRTI